MAGRIKVLILSFNLLFSMLMCSLASRADDASDFNKPVVYLLDIHKSQYRLNKVSEEFRRAGIEYTKFSGIDKKDVNVSEYIQDGILGTRWLPVPAYHPLYHCERTVGTNELHRNPLSAETAALSLSHRMILKETRGQLRDVMILEDDVVVPVGAAFWGRYKDIFNELPDDWDIFYLGAWDRACLNEKLTSRLSTLTYSQEDFSTDCHPGTYAWVVRNQSIGKVLDILQVFHEEIDHQLLRNFGSKLKAYWAHSELVMHDFKINKEKCEVAGEKNLVTKDSFVRCLAREQRLEKRRRR
ncbi:MAG: glycosyltransferase family 25 protein [Endozoicomonas sp.]